MVKVSNKVRTSVLVATFGLFLTTTSYTTSANAAEVKNGLLSPDEIDENVFQQALCTHGIPDPELLIRTSGEYRLSNFLLWQIAYTELLFLEKNWPDFNTQDFTNAILEYKKRERRFGD
jgi:undecaprenyl diphosphate synthase